MRRVSRLTSADLFGVRCGYYVFIRGLSRTRGVVASCWAGASL